MGVIGYGRPAGNHVEGKGRGTGRRAWGPLFVAAATCLPVWQCRTVVSVCVCLCGGLVHGDDCYSAGVGF